MELVRATVVLGGFVRFNSESVNKKKSDTQYCFKVDLRRPESELRGVALLGHPTLTELHELISRPFDRSNDASFSFRFGNAEIEEGARLDDLNLRVGQTIEYVVGSDRRRRETITVESIDDE